MTESKVKAAGNLLASGVPARDVAGNLGVQFLPYIDGFLRPGVSGQKNGISARSAFVFCG